MESLWSYLQNPFLNSARRSFKKFNHILNYTYLRIKPLAGNAFFDELISDLEPHYNSWKELYLNWNTSQNAHKAATFALKNKITDLAGNQIILWDIKIQNVYAKSTPAYTKLLPHDRKPFQSGAQENRIRAVSNLVQSMGSDAALASIKALAVAFSDDINAAKFYQSAKLSDTDNYSAQLKNLMSEAGKYMYLVLAKMMAHYFESPAMVEAYFDLTAIRNGIQIEFTRTVKPLKVINIAKRKLKDTYKIRVINNGTAPITLFYSPQKNETHSTYGKTVEPGQDELYDAADLGDLISGNYIKAYNGDVMHQAHFILMIIK